MKKLLIALSIAAFLLSSCTTSKSLFQSDLTAIENASNLSTHFINIEPTLKPGDKITMSIFGHDEWSVGSINTNFSTNEATGRWLLLDADGQVNLPRIGRLKLAGYTAKEVNYLLEQKYAEIIKNPIINVRVLNHFVTVLGEVNKPGKYRIENEETNLIQMLGMAQGLSPYAENTRLKIIRTVNNRPVELSIDMTDLVTAHQYNITLRPDDVVYIESNRKKSSEEFFKIATPLAGIATAVAVLVSTFGK